VEKETILVVDDNRQLGDFIAYRLLPSLGYRTQTAHTGKQALQAIRAAPPALIVLDLELPDMTGLDILRQLNQEGITIPTILFTAHGSEQIATEAFRLGVEDYLIKPVEPEQLEASISRALTETRLRQETARLNAELKEQVAWLSALSKVGQVVTSTLDSDEVLRRIVDAGVQLTQAEEGFLALLDHATGLFYLRAVKNIDADRAKMTRLPVNDPLVGTAIRSGHAVRKSIDQDGDLIKISTGFFVYSLLYIPIFSKGKPLGVLAVDNRSVERFFTQKDELVLTLLVGYAAVALENAQLYEQARHEIIERRRVEAALRESEERYALAMQGANDGIWDWNLKSGQIYFSPRWKEMLGYGEDEIGSDPQEWLGRIYPSDVEPFKQEVATHLRGQTPHLAHEHRVRHKDGSYRWMLCRGLAVRGVDGSVARIAGSQTDISQRKEAEEKLLRDASTDGLTGLPNRVFFLERLKGALRRAKKQAGYVFAVLFLDLDRFKYINDSLGHPVGDELLVVVAQILKNTLRSTDIVARQGGDEFVILLDGVPDVDIAISTSSAILQNLSRPIWLEGREVFVTTSTSIGIVMSSDDYSDPEDILRDADIAMYAAKARGRGTYQLFDPSMREVILLRVALEADLQQAIEKQQFRVYYQPIVSLKDGTLVGFEALVQWQHPEHGLLPASQFVPLAQEAGLINPIDWWVFEEACRQTHLWQIDFPYTSNLVIHVNLTSSLMARPDLVENIRWIIQKTGIHTQTLRLEITEDIFTSNYEASSRIIGELRKMGIYVLVDNFGIGNGSLHNLKRLPITGLKIDCVFTQGLGERPKDVTIVKTIVELSHELGFQATAEGIETLAQLHQLEAIGCDYGQGFWFSVLLDPEQVIDLLKSGRGALPNLRQMRLESSS
jgi:diguanylate cyclase (GGDEF)-like protein/PAS domain S-box-containing protein